VYAINVENKRCFSMPNGMLVANAIFLGGEDLGSKHVLWNKTFAQNIGDEKHVDIFNLNEFVSKFQKKLCLNQIFKRK